MYKQIKQNKRKFKENQEEDVEDQKRSKNPWGELSECWGVNDTTEDDFGTRTDQKDQGRSVKERLGVKYPSKEPTHSEEQQDSSSSDSENEWCKRSKVLRMRMHADDEEEKIHKRRAKIQQQVSGFLIDCFARKSSHSVPTFIRSFADDAEHLEQRLRFTIEARQVEEGDAVPRCDPSSCDEYKRNEVELVEA